MKKTALTVSLMLLAGLTLSAQAQKIAVVNPMLVLEQSARGKEIVAGLEAFSQEKGKSGTAYQNEINTLKKEINSPALNDEAREKKSALLATKETNFKRFVEDTQREFNDKRTKAFQKLQEEVVPIIHEIRKQKGLAVVLDLGAAGVTSFDADIDISNDVIAAYNAKYPAKK